MKKRIKILVGLILVFCTLYVVGPEYIEDVLQERFTDTEYGSVSIEDVDMDLFRGSLRIEGIKFNSSLPGYTLEGEFGECFIRFSPLSVLTLSPDLSRLEFFNGRVSIVKQSVHLESDTFVIPLSRLSSDMSLFSMTNCDFHFREELGDTFSKPITLQLNHLAVGPINRATATIPSFSMHAVIDSGLLEVVARQRDSQLLIKIDGTDLKLASVFPVASKSKSSSKFSFGLHGTVDVSITPEGDPTMRLPLTIMGDTFTARGLAGIQLGASKLNRLDHIIANGVVWNRRKIYARNLSLSGIELLSSNGSLSMRSFSLRDANYDLIRKRIRGGAAISGLKLPTGITAKRINVGNGNLDLRNGNFTGNLDISNLVFTDSTQISRLNLTGFENGSDHIQIAQAELVGGALTIRHRKGRWSLAQAPTSKGKNKTVSIKKAHLKGAVIQIDQEGIAKPIEIGLSGYVSNLNLPHGPLATVNLKVKYPKAGTMRIKGRLGAASTKPHTRMDLDIRGYDFQLPPLHPIIKGIAPITIVTGVTDFDIDIALTRKGLKGMLDFDISDLEILSAAKKGSKEEKEFTRLQHLVDLIEGPGGVVQLDVPFEGTPDDLKWSFDSIISKAIGKILRKTVFAPFGLFEDIVGLTKGKWNPDIPPTEFAQSSAKIEPDELRDINTLAKALKKRPNLAIALRGSATRQDFTMPASDEQRLEWGEIRVQEVVKHLRRAGLAKHRIQIKDAIISDSAQVDYELVSSKGMVDKMDPTALKIKKKRIEFLIEND